MRKRKVFQIAIASTALFFVAMVGMQTTSYGETSSYIEFPETYEAENENVIFDCQIEIPESVERDGIYMDTVEGYQFAGSDKVLSLFEDGKEIKEQHDSPGSEEYPSRTTFIYTDGSQISVGRSTSYATEYVSAYSQVGVYSDPVWEQHYQEQLSFASAESCIEEMIHILDEIGISSDEFQYDWFSLNREQLAELEKEQINNQLLQKEKVYQEWTDEDEIYLIYAFQHDQEIPVFHEGMGMYAAFALDSLANSPIYALYSARGLENLHVDYRIYNLRQMQEKAELLPFEEIARVVDEKYNSILTDTQYVVTRAKFFQMVRRNEDKKLIAEPIWRFEIEEKSTGRTRVTVVNAVNGKEIVLQ